jgi:hypothetical protein
VVWLSTPGSRWLELSLSLLESLCFEPSAQRLERHWLCGAGLPEALSYVDYVIGLTQRPPADDSLD